MTSSRPRPTSSRDEVQRPRPSSPLYRGRGDEHTAQPHPDLDLVPAHSRYVCPEHHTPVTWRGHGCTDCTTNRREARQRRHNHVMRLARMTGQLQ